MTENVLTAPLEAVDIMEYLPHRFPFLLIDRVISMQHEPEKLLRAIKNVSINEPFFAGHFPGAPVMPGVLIVEAMAQAAGVLVHLAAEVGGGKGDLFYLAKINNARFSKVVVPGDQLLLEVRQKRLVRSMGLYECTASVEGRKVASCEILCAAKS
jgi:3-hydroxyacyl-[acyl-carrier-protein] dehydratase